MKILALDSTPLGLLTQRPGATEADACRQWLAAKAAQGLSIVVPEIVDYELRRELIRSRQAASLRRLDSFISHPDVTLLAVTSDALRLAAELWARARQQGRPTADSHALDVDVILSAQLLAAGFAPADLVVATSNVSHVSLFVPAQLWSAI
jgi:predicted nucleic acid-binding protein